MSDLAGGEMCEGSANEPAAHPALSAEAAVPGLLDRDGRMISYAQNGEDVLLRRVLADVSRGFYIDIGANHPVEMSVTRHFSLNGWRGINIEPNVRLHRELLADRPRDIQLNVGLAAQSGELTYFECPEQPALSTFSATEAAEHRLRGFTLLESRVPVCTLADVCMRHVTGTIDFLSVDVEGFEGEVLAGGDFQKWRPRVVVVEATRPMTATPSHTNWETLLTEQGYLFAHFDGLNRYYVRTEDAARLELFSAPVCVVDRYIPYAHWREREDLIEALRQKHAALLDAQRGRDEVDAQLRAKHSALHQSLADQRELQSHFESLRSEIERANEQNRHLQSQLQSTLEALSAAHQAMHSLHEALQSKHAAMLEAMRQGQDLNAQLMEKHAALLRAIRLGEELQAQVLEKEQVLQEWVRNCAAHTSNAVSEARDVSETRDVSEPATTNENLPQPLEHAA